MTADGIEDVLTGLLAGAIFTVLLGAFSLFMQAIDPIRRRFGSLRRPSVKEPTRIAPDHAAKKNAWRDQLLFRLLPQSDQARKFNLERLRHAGFQTFDALGRYYSLRSLLMVLLPGVVMLASLVLPGFSGRTLVMAVLTAFILGMIGPSYYLDRRVERRHRALRNAIPDTLDMLVVCTEAGLSLNAALQRVAHEIAGIHPEIAAELETVEAEMRAGVDRDQALRGLIDRTGLVDLKDLVGLLIQSLRFGTSIATTLRHYAEDFRDQRMQKAEESAAKLSTKMIFPLIFCFMPSFFIVAVGPAVLKLVRVFASH